MEGQQFKGLPRHSSLIHEVNLRIFEVLSGLGSEDGEFLCECSDVNCVETIKLTVREFAELETRPDRPPFKLPGHPD